MKKVNKLTLILAAIMLGVVGCYNPDLEVIPEWETGVNTYTTLQTGSAASFINGNPTSPINLNFRWISIDSKNTVTKVEFFLLFNEGYVDPDKNPKTARHGGTAGKLFKTLEGSAVGANRTDVGVVVTQADIYNLYKDATFNYCGTTVPVFSNSLKPARSASNPFLAGDSFSMKWTIYLEDGRKIDSWSPSTCTEFPGSNCQYGWAVVCQSNLAGTYSYSTVVSAVGPGGVMPSGPLTGTGTLTSVSTGSYTIPDVSYGVYAAVYGDNPATGVKLSDACDLLTTTGGDQYGDTYPLVVISNDGTSLTFTWANTYGDKATTTLTRTDGKTWPAALTSTPSGSCN